MVYMYSEMVLGIHDNLQSSNSMFWLFYNSCLALPEREVENLWEKKQKYRQRKDGQTD
jgi:hypothetical protein